MLTGREAIMICQYLRNAGALFAQGEYTRKFQQELSSVLEGREV